ncbi:nuclear receptor coactivator 6 isoform X4 [Aedes aegypti]|nr:nuclear receptor coactivator 6 isoform X4 [Aedes aegypti]
MSSSDGSGVYEFVPYESRRYPSSQHHHHHPQTVATFPNPVAPEYHYQPRHHSTYSQQFPYSSSNASSVDGSGGFGRHPAASKRTANIRTQDHQANPGRNSHHYNYHHYQQQQQHQQQHSWSPVAVAASTIAATTGIIATTTTSTSSYTLPNSSVNTNLEATYTEYGESEQRLSCSAHSSSTNSSSSYRVVSGRNYSSRTGERVAASTPDGTTTAISEASTTTTMPPHTNNPHYPSQQQQQTQQGQPPQTQQGNPPPNSHNVAVNVSRGSSDQQSVVASAPQQMYPSQHYMTGGPPGNAMYPMPVIPQPIPGNVYVSNLTANVNVHGFVPHGMPQYVTTGASPAPTGAYITGEVPSGHEMQIMTPRGEARGGMRRNGRSGRIGHNTRPRGGFVPHYIAQQQTVMQSSQPAGIHHQQQPGQVQGQLPQQGVQQSQQQQSQSQSQNQSQSQPSQPPQQHTPDMVQHSMSMEHQPIMSPAQPVTYGGYGGYYFYPPFYPSVTPGHHPSAQHAAGAPILQVPMYQTMYSYSPSVVYQPMYPSEYPLYDGKGEDHNPQQPPEDGVMHQDMWQQPTMIEYNPENVEYIPPEEDMNMMQQGPPTMQPITHVLDPNVPNFTMGPATPIQTDDYGQITPAPSDDYNAINNNAVMSPAANLISSPSSNASSLHNLNQSDMYLVPQQPQQEPHHQQQLQQQPQHQSHSSLMELQQESDIQHEQEPSQPVDQENNYIIEQSPQSQYNQPMSPPPQQTNIHAQVSAPVENSFTSDQPQGHIQEPTPAPMHTTIVQETIQQTPAAAVATVISPTQIPVPLPITITHVPPPQLNVPPPPIPVQFRNLEKQHQQQQPLHHQPITNDSNNNSKKKTNEVASVATPATVAVDKTSEMSTNSSKPVPNQQSQQHHQSQCFVNSNKSQTSTEEVARLQRTVQEKLVFKDDRRNGPYWTNPGSQPPATTISSFTSSTTTIVQHNSSQQQKKTTASVSVSAIPNKEYTSSSSTSSGPSVISSTKPYQKNTSPVPFTTLGITSAPPSIHKQPLAPQKSYSSSEHHTATPVNSGPVMESKKVEAIPQRDSQINTPLPPPGLPPSLSVPPPQRQYTQGQMIVQTPYVPPPPATTAAAPQTKSWASLFNPSSSSATSTPGPTSSIVQPIATSAPVAPSLLAAGPALPTPSPFAPSFVPTQHRSSHSSSASNQSADKTTAASSSTSNKPIAKVSPFDKSNNNSNSGTTAMSYSAASAQGLPSASAGHTTSASASAASTASAGSKNKNNAAAQAQAAAAAAKPEQIDENTLKLGEFLSAYQIENNSISILPRGLINRSNYCYINAILQALVACPPFYHLMRAIRSLPAARNSKHQKPFIDAMSALVDEFSTLQLRSKVQRDKTKKDETPEIQCDSPMEPLMIHRMLNLLRSDIFQVEGRQEDAEEFLGCVLNRLNDEMIELMKLSKNESDVNGDDAANGEVHPDDQDDWKVIRGNRNKGTVTRTTDFGRSPMSDIFGGKLRSRVHREGDHATDNIQPFFTLQLDIEKATSVKDALDLLVGKDQLEGVTCSKTKQEIAAWQQVTLEELPIVMILHLKCFDYKMDGCTKILKALEFPIELKIDSKLMSSKGKSYTAKQKQYKLFAVVYHDGKEASKGHYITDVFHAGYGSWIRYDDSTVKPVSENNVLHPKSPRVPYLLYYRRLDTHYHGSAGGAGATTSGSTGTGGSGYGSGSSSSNTTSSSNNSSTGGNSNYSSSVNTGGHYGGSK